MQTPLSRRSAGVLLVALTMFAAACGGSEEAASTTTTDAAVTADAVESSQPTAEPVEPTATTPPAEEPTPTVAPLPTSTSEVATTDTEPNSADDAPPCEFGGSGGWSVINVAIDDPDGGLVMHQQPALASPQNGLLPFDAAGLSVLDCRVELGSERQWLLVDSVDFGRGWASAAYLAQLPTGGPGDPVELEYLVGLRVDSVESDSIRAALSTLIEGEIVVDEFVGVDAQGGTVDARWTEFDDSVGAYEAQLTLTILRDAAGEPTGELEITRAIGVPQCTRGVSDGLCI